MKNLKFRAWDKRSQKMFANDELIIWNSCIYANDRKKLTCDNLKGWSILDKYLMQSTGLFDAFGTEIFEGDIVTKNQGETFGIVRYGICQSSLCFYVEQNYKGSELTYPINPNRSRYYKVVGNIYENAKLVGLELQVKGTYDKGNERWYIDTDEATVEAMNSFLKEHDIDVFESWLGYLEGGMSSEALAFVDLLQTMEDEIELADGSKIKLVEG